MCGIVGHLGYKPTKEFLLNGLKEMEYRGYDSSGITILHNKSFSTFKSVGKLQNLLKKIPKTEEVKSFNIGIGHTRWATHGKPTLENTHPHSGKNTQIVHNGIIENYISLKKELEKKGYFFNSQTDTEVIVHLFEELLKKYKEPFVAFKNTINKLEGSYSILLINNSEKDKIFFSKNGSPLIIGIKDNDKYFSSSESALIEHCDSIHHCLDHEIGFVCSKSIYIEKDNIIIDFKNDNISQSKIDTQKDGYDTFTEKEIHEQTNIIKDTISGRILDNKIFFEELGENFFKDINEVTICACGTSYHSALVASYLIERNSKIKCNVEYGSEYRYREPFLDKKNLFISISQSGETADTLESLKMCSKFGQKTLTICNTNNSSMTQISEKTILTRAGIEKGVASTKAFSTQVLVLWMISLQIGQEKGTIPPSKLIVEIDNIKKVSKSLIVDKNIHEKCKRLSKRYLHGHGFFFIGRDVFYPLALEGALKLKEITYLHAEGYPAGEMKHGPIALADPELFTIALMSKNIQYDKIKSNVEELSARDSTICSISSEDFELADDFIKINETNHYMLDFFEMLVCMQLLSIELAKRLDKDIDMPRNLAKSVTVE
jgi:glucosamine--fructose-6-phosphate aminotransferase (isomerizing)